jgi:hypothetical protein
MRLAFVVRSLAHVSIRVAAVALTVGTLAGCGTDDVGPRSHMVGGRCTTNTDCVDRCMTGAEFPGGYCTVGCASHADCPGGSVCVASGGGVCLAACHLPADCKAFGVDYACALRTSEAGGPGVLACAAN